MMLMLKNTMQIPNTFSSFPEKLYKLPHAKIASLIIIILFGYIAYLFAQITWVVLDTPNTSNHQPLKNVQVNTNTLILDTKSIRSLNLFGDYNAAPVINNEPEEIEDAPETSLNLILAGVVASNDHNKSAAIIEYNNAQEIYIIDETIKGTRAVLKKVFSDRVHIRHSGRLETLMLDGFDYDEKKPIKKANAFTQQTTKKKPSKIKTSNQNNGQPKRVDQRTNKALTKKAKAFKNDINADPGKITDYLQISPKRTNGNIIGYRLMPGKNAEFFKAAGLKSGDVAIQMNGLDLSQPREAAQALKALKEERDVSLLLDRNGDITEILFSIDE